MTQLIKGTPHGASFKQGDLTRASLTSAHLPWEAVWATTSGEWRFPQPTEPDPSTAAVKVVTGHRKPSGGIEALASDGNLRSCHSGRGGLGRCSETRRDSRHKVDIACFQETKLKGSSNKEVNGYKFWYSGTQALRPLEWKGETVNVISAYAPQVGLSEEDKKTFWDSLDEVVREFPTDQRLILGGDLNGHIGAATEGYSGVHGGFSYGRLILDFATANDLVVVNSNFKKRDHHLITVFLGEACSSQHRLLALDTLFKSVERMRVGSAVPRILWKNLNGDAPEAFRSRVAEKSKVAVKQARFREFLSCREGNQEEWLRAHERYKEAKKVKRPSSDSKFDPKLKTLRKRMIGSDLVSFLNKLIKIHYN
ncbi:craniofacial development protein 2 [Tanacetum coccineum]